MSHGLLDIDKSPILALTKSSSKRVISLSVLTLTSLSFSIGVVPINIAGVTNQQSASAQINTYACNQKTGRGCYILLGAVYTWNPWSASGMCRQKFGNDSFALKYTAFNSPVYHCVKNDPRNVA